MTETITFDHVFYISCNERRVRGGAVLHESSYINNVHDEWQSDSVLRFMFYNAM
jgi:hypothetical protein